MFSLFGQTSLPAQDFALFQLSLIEYDNDTKAFVSLSDIDRLSENIDSLAIPDLSERSQEDAKQFEYFKLNSKYRNQFLLRTTISETDNVYIYSFEKNILISFPVKNLNVVACLNVYGADWPYRQDEFMIGFEVDKKYLTGFEEYFVNTFVYIGKKSPFVLNQLKPVVWKKIDSKDFPSEQLIAYDTSYAGKCIIGDTYCYESNGLQYFIQDMVRLSDNWNAVKRLLVIEIKTKRTVCEKIYYSGESASFAPLDNQWTGKLFRNKPAVIFGFQYVSFGCPFITFLSPSEKDIYINCDNRH